jgi:hypothetical protein
MKQKDILTLVIIGFFAAIFSTVLAGKIFNSSGNHNLKIPVVQVVDGNFPQVQTDSTYQAFFNDKALDPTQLIKIGTSQNDKPFSGGQ